MLHENQLELGSRWLDGDLGEQEEAILLQELKDHPELRREIEAMDQLRRKLRRASLADRPPELMDALVENFRQAPPRRGKFSMILPLLAAAAMIAISFLLIEEVGNRPIHLKKQEHQLFALGNPPSAPNDVPLGPLEKLLKEDLREPELRIPHALIAEGPLPAPPPDAEGSCLLEIAGRRYTLNGVHASSKMRVGVSGETITACGGGDRESCQELLGRSVKGVPDGSYVAQLLPVEGH